MIFYRIRLQKAKPLFGGEFSARAYSDRMRNAIAKPLPKIISFALARIIAFCWAALDICRALNDLCNQQGVQSRKNVIPKLSHFYQDLFCRPLYNGPMKADHRRVDHDRLYWKADPDAVRMLTEALGYPLVLPKVEGKRVRFNVLFNHDDNDEEATPERPARRTSVPAAVAPPKLRKARGIGNCGSNRPQPPTGESEQ